MILGAVLFALAPTGLADCVPARWDSSSPGTLKLLAQTPVSCLLLDPAHWEPAFLAAAKKAGLRLLAAASNPQEAARAEQLGFDGLTLDASFSGYSGGLPVVRMSPRSEINLSAPPPVIATSQGVWPGIRVEKDGAATALPTGAPWIDTNGGFLRFVRASVPPHTAVWIAMRPPEGEALKGRQYLQALADASFSGAHWVFALDRAFFKALAANDPRFLAEWSVIASGWRFLERVREYSLWPGESALLLVQSPEAGALASGGFIDMMAARHLPVKVSATVPPGLHGIRFLLNVRPSSANRAPNPPHPPLAYPGVKVIEAPGPALGPGFVIPSEEIKTLADAWREINTALGRMNLGMRVFGAPSTICVFNASAGGKRRAIHLLNFSGYPVEGVTIHVAGSFSSARILTPAGDRPTAVVPIEGGIEIDGSTIGDVAVVLVE